MNRNDYKCIRALIRENGAYAENWLDADDIERFRALRAQGDDYLAMRARMALKRPDKDNIIMLSAPLGIFMAWRNRCQNRAK